MLIAHEMLFPEGELGLWRIEEPEEWFLEQMKLYPMEEVQLAEIKGHRRLEWLAGRYLLHQMSGRELRGACLKDEYGKPYLEDSLYDISMSHSHSLAAVIASPRTVGVDIQLRVPAIERIAPKFMREQELKSLSLTDPVAHMHVYWGAKECLYKCYGRKKLDFCQHLLVTPFEYKKEGGQIQGSVVKGDFDQTYQLFYRTLESQFMLVYGWEDLGDVRIAADLR